MNETRRCPECDTEIPANAPAGQCPKCLMKAGFASEDLSQPQLDETAPSPGSAGFQAPPVEEIAERFPQLEVLELVGQGGMGAVYKARQPGLDRLVAVKILPPEVGRDPAFAERFMREARAMARLSHPNIVAVHDFGQTDGLFYFVMEFIDGANLRQTMQASGLKPEQALAVVPQICDALQYAHDEGVVHRDIKPENILLDKKGRVKIADFGLSKLLREDKPEVSLTGTHQVMGTLRYMAPEQMQGTKSVDHRADIYSLGVVFYELLTGDVPMGRFDPPSQKVQIDVRLDEVVLRALAQEPAKRYQRASEVKTDVEAVASDPIAASRQTEQVVVAKGVYRPLTLQAERFPAMPGIGAANLTAGTLLLLLGLLFLLPAVTGMSQGRGLLLDWGHAGCWMMLTAVLLWTLGTLVAGIGLMVHAGVWSRILTLVVSATGLLFGVVCVMIGLIVLANPDHLMRGQAYSDDQLGKIAFVFTMAVLPVAQAICAFLGLVVRWSPPSWTWIPLVLVPLLLVFGSFLLFLR